MQGKDLEALQQVQTFSIHERQHKVSVADFVNLQGWQRHDSLRALFPRILKGLDISNTSDIF